MNIDEGKVFKYINDEISRDLEITGNNSLVLLSRKMRDAFTAGAESQGEVIKELKKDLDWALDTLEWNDHHNNYFKCINERRTKHGLDV